MNEQLLNKMIESEIEKFSVYLSDPEFIQFLLRNYVSSLVVSRLHSEFGPLLWPITPVNPDDVAALQEMFKDIRND